MGKKQDVLKILIMVHRCQICCQRFRPSCSRPRLDQGWVNQQLQVLYLLGLTATDVQSIEHVPAHLLCVQILLHPQTAYKKAHSLQTVKTCTFRKHSILMLFTEQSWCHISENHVEPMLGSLTAGHLSHMCVLRAGFLVIFSYFNAISLTLSG